MKKFTNQVSIILFLTMLVACGFQQPLIKQEPIEIKLKIEGVDAVKVEQEGNKIVKTMQVRDLTPSPSASLLIVKEKAYHKISGGLYASDLNNLKWDLIYLENETDVKELMILLSSPGGSAFIGLAIADVIERNIKRGKIKITIFAEGLVASAAIPIFAAAKPNRIASKTTLFMVHEASTFHWPGYTTVKDLAAKQKMLELLQNKYLEFLENHTNLTTEQWKVKEGKITWFSPEMAMEWGLVDKIE